MLGVNRRCGGHTVRPPIPLTRQYTHQLLGVLVARSQQPPPLLPHFRGELPSVKQKPPLLESVHAPTQEAAHSPKLTEERGREGQCRAPKGFPIASRSDQLRGTIHAPELLMGSS